MVDLVCQEQLHEAQSETVVVKTTLPLVWQWKQLPVTPYPASLHLRPYVRLRLYTYVRTCTTRRNFFSLKKVPKYRSYHISACRMSYSRTVFFFLFDHNSLTSGDFGRMYIPVKAKLLLTHMTTSFLIQIQQFRPTGTFLRSHAKAMLLDYDDVRSGNFGRTGIFFTFHTKCGILL